MPLLCYIVVRDVKLKGAMLRKKGLGHESKNVLLQDLPFNCCNYKYVL